METGTAIGSALEGHISWVNSVVFSPDGIKLASQSYPNTVCLWDVELGILIETKEHCSIQRCSLFHFLLIAIFDLIPLVFCKTLPILTFHHTSQHLICMASSSLPMESDWCGFQHTCEVQQLLYSRILLPLVGKAELLPL